jgi:hypothetical protein
LQPAEVALRAAIADRRKRILGICVEAERKERWFLVFRRRTARAVSVFSRATFCGKARTLSKNWRANSGEAELGTKIRRSNTLADDEGGPLVPH